LAERSPRRALSFISVSMTLLEQATLVFLVMIFAAAEIFRARRALRGVIVAVQDDVWWSAAMPVIHVRVRLNGGEEVTAALNCCTACLGRFNLGDEVRVANTRDGYVVDLPWFRRR
jgi:hypothetical protein